jgi:hypothetical protein
MVPTTLALSFHGPSSSTHCRLYREPAALDLPPSPARHRVPPQTRLPLANSSAGPGRPRPSSVAGAPPCSFTDALAPSQLLRWPRPPPTFLPNRLVEALRCAAHRPTKLADRRRRCSVLPTTLVGRRASRVATHMQPMAGRRD